MSISTLLPLVLYLSLLTSTLAAPTAFTPKDSFFIACGSNNKIGTPDGKSYQSDQDAHGFLSAEDKYLVSDPNAIVPSKIYSSARVFLKDATYTFTLQDSGWHWVRLHFLPIKTDIFKLETASFNVYTNEVTLLHSFSTTNLTMKEYLIHVKSQRFSIKFEPQKSSAAFINAIEVSTAPDTLIGDSGQSLSPVGEFNGLNQNSLETMYRVNVGGNLVTADNDTLGRTWVQDGQYLNNKAMAKNVNVQTSVIKYPQGVTPYIAPQTVYATAAEMADSNTMVQSFNVSWDFTVEKSYSYLVRLHFCDIVSTSLNDLYFNVYINGKTAISSLDLSSITGKLATPNYQDIVVDSSLVQDKVSVQIGPAKVDSGSKNAILNGVEVFKMNNTVSSLDGEFGPDGKAAFDGKHKKTVAAVGFAMMFGAFVGLGAMVIKWHKRPQDWQRRNSFSSWLLPLHAGDSTVFGKSNYGSHKSSIFTTGGLGRRFTFDEIKDATKNFEASGVIGVGGFGNVYIGTLDATQGSFGYLDPEYFRKQQLTDKSDVYSFGVVLLEVLCARPAINPALPREQVNLAEWAMNWKRKDMLEKILDPVLVGSINPESMKKFSEAAEKCLAEYGSDRPTMGDVLWNLEYALQLQEASAQGKLDDATTNPNLNPNPTATTVTPVVTDTTLETRPSAIIPEQTRAMDERSGTALLAQFSNLSGR
ncbi:hypothetical protein SOVF_027020 [Spinacia oleracea]|nr:hypothetical protein SOVF_027020 [Spinacia oleracea]